MIWMGRLLAGGAAGRLAGGAAGAAGRLAAGAAGRLAGRTPLLRCCSNGQTPQTPPSTADTAWALFQQFISSFKGTQLNVVQAAALCERIAHVLKTYPPEIALPMIHGMAEELSLVCHGSTLESRLVKVEVGRKIERAFVFGTFSVIVIGGVLILMPGAMHVMSINAQKHRDATVAVIEALKSRVAEIEQGPKATQAMMEDIKVKFAELERAIDEKGSDNETKALVQALKVKISDLESSIHAKNQSQVDPAPGRDKN